MISGTGRLQTLGPARQRLDLKGRLIKMEIHAVLRMVLVALTIMDLMLASRPQVHRRPRFPCLRTIDPPRRLFLPPPPAHAAVHLSAERAPETVRTAHRSPAAAIPPNRHIMALLHAITPMTLVPAMALHVPTITILVLAKVLL